MPLARGHVMPPEFNRGAPPNLPPFVDSTTSAHGLRIGWPRQISRSAFTGDTASSSPSSTSEFGEGFTIVGTRPELSTSSGIVRTVSLTTTQTTRNRWELTSRSSDSIAIASETSSPSGAGTRATEFSTPSTVTEGRSSVTTERRSSFLDPSPSSYPSSKTSAPPLITVGSTIYPPSRVSYTILPTRTAPPSYSSLIFRPPLCTHRSSSSSRGLSASDSAATSISVLVTSLRITTTIWISLPTTISITVTTSIPTLIPTSIPTTPSTAMTTLTLPPTLSSLTTALSWDPSTAPSYPTTQPWRASSSGGLPSTSNSSPLTDSLSSSSFTSSSSRSVLQQQTTTLSTTTTVPIIRTTRFTTVVRTSTTVGDGQINTETTTEAIPTGTPTLDAGGDSNIFARNKGALAGLTLGCIALAALVAVWALFAYRRHRMRSAQNADAVAALRSGPGRTRALMLDEDDVVPPGDMTFLGSRPVSRTSGGARYALLRGGNNVDGAAEDSISHPQVPAGGAPVAIPRRVDGEMEEAILMHPSNRSDIDVTTTGANDGTIPEPQVPSSAGSSPSGAGLDALAWFDGQVVSSPNPSTVDAFNGAAHDRSSARPTSPSSVYSDGVISAHHDSHSIVGAMGTYLGGEQSAHSRNSYASSSSHGHGAAGSSFGEHGSSNDDRNGGSSAGDVPSTTTHSSQLLLPRSVSVSVPAPSSLLPTKTAPPTSFRNFGDNDRAGRKSGIIGRSLRSLRLRSDPAELPLATTASASALVGAGAVAKRQALQGPSSTLYASAAHPQPPRLGSVPFPPFRSEPAIPEGAAPSCTPGSGPRSLGVHARTASGAPVWPGLGPLAGRSNAPSPTLTDASMRTPDGLLNPKWVNGDGMRSQGAISFRDDMDYSRPIGGWVNNRQHSSTSVQTMSSAGPYRRHSLESYQTNGAHTQAVPIPPDGDHTAPPRYEELSWLGPSIEVTPPSATSR